MIAKLEAYDFSWDALKYMRSYLTNSKKRVRVNKNFTTWESIIAEILQGSMLGPLLFNVCINDLFLFVSNSLRISVIMPMTILSKCFEKNHMVKNADKCHFRCLSKDLLGNYMVKVNNRNTRTRFEKFKVNNKDTRTTSLAS